ncbi:MAG: TetR/AcrR family transcriptional regulator [Pseudomonadota bacterium]
MARTIAKDHGDKRGQILAKAAHVFARDGFDKASMSQIAEACGISKANIYHYYRGKDALLFDLLDGYLSALRERVIAADDPGLSTEERFRHTLREILLAYQGADDEHRIQMSGLGGLPDDQQQILRGYQRDLVRHLSDLLHACAPDRLSDKKTLRATTMSVFGMLNWYFMWNGGSGAKAREDYADLVADLTLNGVR